MNAIEDVSTASPLAVAVDRLIHSATYAAAGALNWALMSVPWYSAVAQPTQVNLSPAAIAARGKAPAVAGDSIRPFRQPEIFSVKVRAAFKSLR